MRVSGVARAGFPATSSASACSNDISGIFQDTNGMGSVEAARMGGRISPAGPKHQGQIVYAITRTGRRGSAIARKWLDVDASMRSSTCRIPRSASTINSLLRDTRMTFFWRHRPQAPI